MCHEVDSRPPSAPGAAEGSAGRQVELSAADGNRILAYAARAQSSSGAGVVILPDARGLHAFYRHLAERFADAGFDAVAIDYFGRTADSDDRSDAFVYQPHLQQTTADGIAADASAGAAYLRSAEGGAVSRVCTVGFCFGGGQSWRLAADLDGLSGAVGFYGRPALAADAADRMRAPLLLLIAGADAHIPPSEGEALARAVRDAGGEAEAVVYDGAPHSFFDRTFADHRAACDDAWRRVGDFIRSRAG